MGAIIVGVPQSFVMGAREMTSPPSTSLLLSIASPRVLHNALHTVSDSNKEFSINTFPKFFLQQLEEDKDAT
jgi:hypothetical protein